MYKITTPVKGYNGMSASVDFTKGVAYVEKLDPNVESWLKSKGYTVEKEKQSNTNDNKVPARTVLAKEAKELGITIPKGTKAPQILVMIEEHKKSLENTVDEESTPE